MASTTTALHRNASQPFMLAPAYSSPLQSVPGDCSRTLSSPLTSGLSTGPASEMPAQAPHQVSRDLRGLASFGAAAWTLTLGITSIS